MIALTEKRIGEKQKKMLIRIIIAFILSIMLKLITKLVKNIAFDLNSDVSSKLSSIRTKTYKVNFNTQLRRGLPRMTLSTIQRTLFQVNITNVIL